MAYGTRSRSGSGGTQTQQHQGNLGTVLTEFDHSHPEQKDHEAPGSLTINVPTADQDDGEDRERSLTLGSEFDLGWALGKDGRAMSISGLFTPMGDPADGMSESTATTHVSGSTSSTHGAAPAPVQSSATHLPGVPENSTQTDTSVPVKTEEEDDDNVSDLMSASIPVKTATGPTGRARGDSTASAFLNGILYQQQLPDQGQTRAQSAMIAHTPPTQMGTSYENAHFGKRMRSGSISGRLRSASDLEDTGVISRDQKAILKDLIIAGDSSVQGAIDKYEAGDPSALEAMIKSGALLARSSADVDLLGDLDLDFLNVHGGDHDDEMMFGNMDDVGGDNNAKQQSSTSDGIGDLEFNGDLSTAARVEPTPVGSSSQSMIHRMRINSVDDLEVHRMRANSLAMPGFLLEGSHADDASQFSFGRWMDQEVSGHPQPSMEAAGITALGNMKALPTQECETLMTSKFRENDSSAAATTTDKASPKKKKPKVKKDKKEKKEKKKYTKKDKTEPRERKSQSKMKDMMESITSNGDSKQGPSTSGDGEEEENKEVESGLGRPRSMSDPNLSVRLDDHGLLNVEGPEGWVGAYSPDSRQMRIDRFLEKRNHRVWVKKVKYDVRKNFADSRLRVKGRFVKKEDEMLMRELMSLT